ncbi:MAG: hypothetical protein ACW99E_01805 [Promethearchaeota archaeon]|jgi:hypothetical protein
MTGMISNVNAIRFKSGVKENEELLWKCKVCNKAEMELIFGIGWDELGLFKNISREKWLKWKIIETTTNDTNIKIEYFMWSWSVDKDWSGSDNISQIIYYSNPNEYNEGLNFTNYAFFVPFWFPIPVGEYMGGLKLIKWYDVDNRVLPTLNVNLPKHEITIGHPNKDINIIAIYNDRGILNSYKLYGKGNTVVIDIALESLPPYVIPTLVGLSGVFTLGVITVLFKRKKK